MEGKYEYKMEVAEEVELLDCASGLHEPWDQEFLHDSHLYHHVMNTNFAQESADPGAYLDSWRASGLIHGKYCIYILVPSKYLTIYLSLSTRAEVCFAI